MFQARPTLEGLSMILEFSFDYRSSSLVYERVFFQVLNKHSLSGKIYKNHFELKFYVEADDAKVLEEFATTLSISLPHSIFLYKSDAQMVEKMPDTGFLPAPKHKYPLPFCPTCLNNVKDSKSKSYYDIFTECEACGYDTKGERRSYKSEFEKTAKDIKSGKIVEFNTFYGKYFTGVPNEVCNDVEFDIITYDLATVQRYANVEKHEITTLGSFEKPLIKLKKKMKFTMDYEGVEADLIRFKLPDDFVLSLLMEELHKIDVDAIFVTKQEILAQQKLLLVNYKETLEPIEVVASEKDVTIVSGTKGLPEFLEETKRVNFSIDSLSSVIKEHRLKDDSIAGISLSKEHENSILIYGSRYGVIEYLSLNFEFLSIEEVFDRIIDTDETGVRIVANYKKKFPKHFAKISKIVFNKKEFNIFRLWGVVAIVLDYAQTQDPVGAAKVLEANAMSFLGEKGPRIDYKLLNIDGKVFLDPLMTIRTAMSFRLAGVDPLMMSYGIIESFLEFIGNELDEIKNTMDITAVVVTGSLLANKHLFSKMSKEISINHNIYFNNEIPIEGALTALS